MSDEPELKVHKFTGINPVAPEQIIDAAEVAIAWHEYLSASPEERAEWARRAAEERAEERAAFGPSVPLTLEGLLGALEFTRAYAEHLMQPYCGCCWTPDGWDYCSHARDLGLEVGA